MPNDEPVERSAAAASPKARVEAARASGDGLGLRNALLDAFAEFGPRCTTLVAARDYRGAESLLGEWGQMLDSAASDLTERQLLFAHSRLQASRGTFEETRGLEAYFAFGDFVDAPRILETAELHHERSAEFAARVAFPADAPPEALSTRDGIAAMQRAECLRVRGMRLLIQGEFESEAGGLKRAAALLGQSVETLGLAEADPAALPGAGDAVSEVAERGLRELNFVEFARALLHKTLSDAALLRGDLLGAAAEQLARAEALKRCQTMHLRAGRPLNEGFARRLARDVHVALQRHDRLAAEAGSRPRWEWLKALLFFALAAGSVVLFLWLDRGQFAGNQAVLAILLLFVMAIAGIGARLVGWKEAATLFRGGSKG